MARPTLSLSSPTVAEPTVDKTPFEEYTEVLNELVDEIEEPTEETDER